MLKDGACKKCKALKVYGGAAKCELGFSLDEKTLTPKEQCPRPLTYLALIELRNEQ